MWSRFAIGISLASACLMPAGVVSQQNFPSFGHEWIDSGQTYFKIAVREDGIYRIHRQTLITHGVPADIRGAEFRMYHLGRQIPIYVTTTSALEEGDFIEFYGEKNRGHFDERLYEDPDHMLNPEVSLYTDQSAYFLTWTPGADGLRLSDWEGTGPDSIAPERFYRKRIVRAYSEFYVKNFVTQGGVHLSSFEPGEGYGTNWFDTRLFEVALPDIYLEEADSARLDIRMATFSADHQLSVLINGNTAVDSSFFGFRKLHLAFPLSPDDIANELTVRVSGRLGGLDRYSVGMINFEYPAQFTFGNRPFYRFQLDVSKDPQNVEISNFSSSGEVLFYDLTNGLRVVGQIHDSIARISLPPSDSPRELAMVCTDQCVLNIENLQKVEFAPLQPAEFIIISHPDLYDSDADTNWVDQYAQYRRSVDGGSFSTTVVDVRDLYDRFSYGIEGHPLAVRHFANWLYREWDEASFIFLIGKGRLHDEIRFDNNPGTNKNLIPTYGIVGSDNLLVAAPGSSSPLLPVGRLPVTSGADVEVFLKKMRTYEHNLQSVSDPGSLWLKKVIHLSGGKNADEQELLKGFMNQMKEIIESGAFGGQVTTFLKSSNEQVTLNKSQTILDRISEGVGIINYFGHSSASTFGFNISDVNEYENAGKYMIFNSMGCSAGQIHANTKSLSEQYVLTPGRGAIAFVSSSGLSFLSALNYYGRDWYEKLSGAYYGKTLGQVVAASAAELAKTNLKSHIILAQQVTLNGDPATRLYSPVGPDYTINPSSLRTEPSLISTALDSFDLCFDLVNLGKNQNDEFLIRCVLRRPDGTGSQEFFRQVSSLKSLQQECLHLPAGGLTAGNHTISLYIDDGNLVEEFPQPPGEENNELSGEMAFKFFVRSNLVKTLYPPEFGIAGSDHPTLTAYFEDPGFKPRKVFFQLDTSTNFTGPALVTTDRTTQFNSIDFDVGPLMPGQVYYWRVSPDSISPEVGFEWDTSSFVYLPGRDGGWNQSHYYQFLKNRNGSISPDRHRNFTFATGFREVTIEVMVGRPTVQLDFGDALPGARPWHWTDYGICVLVSTDDFWENPPGGAFGSVNNPDESTVVFLFQTETLEGRASLIQFLTEIVPDGAFVCLYTYQLRGNLSFFPEKWTSDTSRLGTSIFKVLEAQGAEYTSVLESSGSIPYGIVYQKNNGVIEESVAIDINDRIDLTISLPVRGSRGHFTTGLIGPVGDWKELSYRLDPHDIVEDDSFFIEVFGLSDPATEQPESILQSYLGEDTIDLSHLDTEVYPYLQLDYFAEGLREKSPPDLEFWRISHRVLPEFTINPSSTARFLDSIPIGHRASFDFTVSNVATTDSDSVLLRFEVREQSGSEIWTERIQTIRSGEHLEYTFDLLADADGLVEIIIEVNPDNDQPELTSANNFLVKRFHILRDRHDPMLDVTFDGIHIRDGDIISPRAEIAIALWDHIGDIPLERPGLIQAEILFPDGLSVHLDPVDPEVDFLRQAEDEENRIYLIYRPQQLPEGLYFLSVTGEDGSGNSAGAEPFEISFRVIHERTISALSTYPNPFTDRTSFVYSLTGDVALIDYGIQIFSAHGHLVRYIGKDEIGQIPAGQKRTMYVWDGRDQSGHLLSSGVYFYKFEFAGSEYVRKLAAPLSDHRGKLVIQR